MGLEVNVELMMIVLLGHPHAAHWAIVGVVLKNGIGMEVLDLRLIPNPAAPNLIGYVYSALKLGKKVQFQKCKNTLFAFSKMAKN